MPSRNVIKFDAPDSYHHVYARGGNKQQIFLEDSDKDYFLYLLARYLSSETTSNRFGYVYPNYANQLELLAFCLMDNHVHLLVFQKDQGSMTALMRSLMTSYSRYFNLKYNRTGPLFESRYKASHITHIPYLEHISRYIHLNPRFWRRYKYSSLGLYVDGESVSWLKPEKITDLFGNKSGYLGFVSDYLDHKEMLETIKTELAGQ